MHHIQQRGWRLSLARPGMCSRTGLTRPPPLCLQIGMELWAQFAHKALWHDYEPGWKLHKSHHVPREGPFEDNDVFAVVNAIPAMGLCAYGFLTPNVGGGGC